MTPEFNRWWDADELTQTNDYSEDTPAFWAWEGWQAAMRERPDCNTCVLDSCADIQTVGSTDGLGNKEEK